MGTKTQLNSKDTEKFKDITISSPEKANDSWNINLLNINPKHTAELETMIKSIIAELKKLQRILKVIPIMGSDMKWSISIKGIPDEYLETLEIKLLNMLGREKKKME